MNDLLQQATTLHNQGKLIEAERIYRALITADPQNADALALLGVLMSANKNFVGAVVLLKRAIASDPATPLFRFYLGNVFSTMGSDEQAIGAYQQAVELKQDYTEARFKLAMLLLKHSRFAETIGHLQIVIQSKPDLAAAHVALALALEQSDREEEAIAPLQTTLRLKPDFVEGCGMLGVTYQKLGLLDEAEATLHNTIKIANCIIPDEDKREVAEEEYSVHHWDLALLELLRGDFRKGFAHYRARFKKTGRVPRLPLPRPIWHGEDLRGKKILAVGEQGFGDVFMMCRFVPLLRDRGAKVTLLVHQAAGDLLRRAQIADEVVCVAPHSQGSFDFQTSLFDLPYYLGTTVETIPAVIPYLPAPDLPEEMVLPKTQRPKIGVVWAGRADFGNDRRRSLPLSCFAELFTETGCQFFSLTQSVALEDRQVLGYHSVVDLSTRLTNFTATARYLSQLDLVITCDTAVAHLAGAMGKPVWVLLPFAPDWRWLTEREDSPWYPTMRLFRQSKKADWAEVIGRVRQELGRFAGR